MVAQGVSFTRRTIFMFTIDQQGTIYSKLLDIYAID